MTRLPSAIPAIHILRDGRMSIVSFCGTAAAGGLAGAGTAVSATPDVPTGSAALGLSFLVRVIIEMTAMTTIPRTIVGQRLLGDGSGNERRSTSELNGLDGVTADAGSGAGAS